MSVVTATLWSLVFWVALVLAFVWAHDEIAFLVRALA